MKDYYVDLHVHIGRAGDGAPVKITAARDMTLANIMHECMHRKGIQMVGVIDTLSPRVQVDMQQLIQSGELRELPGGGLSYRGKVTLIPGGEVETTEKGRGGAHCLCYFPTLDALRDFTRQMAKYITNITLSSQKSRLSMQELAELTVELGGMLVPAHVFTPHKGVYGCCVKSLLEILTPAAFREIPAVELGLSADTDFADTIDELAEKSFLTNSDAHSLPKIGREFNLIRMVEPDFAELKTALERKNGRYLTGNYGYHPRLGKYHRTHCEDCSRIVEEEPPVTACPGCGRPVDNRRVTMGVYDRICLIRDREAPQHPDHRPPYRYQVPLQDLPGVGAKTMAKLLGEFGTEMAVLHEAPEEELNRMAGEALARLIMAARTGELTISAGGGGRYGRVIR
jgi:uncharacterized protein (TIGR00375 family)